VSEPTFAEIVVSQLGTPRDQNAEFLGAALVVLAVFAYLALELGLFLVIRRAWDALTQLAAGKKDVKHEPVEKAE
jgi:hypothetical protein